jgi:hypothetical protein
MARDTGRKACCFVSEMLEEVGFDRQRARVIRRQVLQGIILFCQWQLDRMGADRTDRKRSRAKPRAQQVKVE